MSAVRWGVLTTARIAQDRFLPGMQKARNAVVSAISSPSGRAAEVASRFDIPTVYASHEELLADPNIEAVYLPFPNGLHAEWIIAAAEAGKDISARSHWSEAWKTTPASSRPVTGTV